ncbi:hypothetical protein IKE86_01610 [Candidatus Saccharibacteria bacterium]|nr:hypothetical protein [Candidatus Saccharibacteria bacterium]
MENTEIANIPVGGSVSAPATAPKPKGKAGSAKVIVCSIAGLVFLSASFFLVEKHTNLIGIFNNNDTPQNLSDSEVEEEDFLDDDAEELQLADGESKFKNTNDLAFSGLSDEQYELVVMFLEDEFAKREPEARYFVLDNTSITYSLVNFEPENVASDVAGVEVLPEEGFTDMSSSSSSADTSHGYSAIAFDVVSSSRKKYNVVLNTGGALSGFKEIKISEI